MRALPASVVFLGLAACGGGSGGTGFIPGPATFTQIVNEHSALENAATNSALVTQQNTPSNPLGSVTFDGFIVMDTQPASGGSNPAGEVYYSRLSLNADFSGPQTISGTANSFWYYDETVGGPVANPVGGSISVANTGAAFIYDDTGTAGTFESTPLTMSGNLAIGGGPLVNVDSGASNVAGTFSGDDGGGFGTNFRYFAGQGETHFVNGDIIPTRIITEQQ